MPQEEYPLLSLIGEAADVLLLFEVLGDDGSHEGHQSVDWGFTLANRGRWASVPCETKNNCHCLLSTEL